MRDEQVVELLSQMSMAEKIGELFQIPAYFFCGGNATGPAAEMGITDADIRVAGSCLSVIGAAQVREIQKTHMENHPHRIPMLFMADIINGYRTVFPIPLAQGCTFDPELAEQGAAIAAKEAAASGIQVTFSPMADLVQDPRWGRVMESTGEDSYLNGRMAAAMVRGYQGENLTDPGRIAACLKHFAGYGAPLGGRDYNCVELSPRTLREDYLPAYKAAIDAGVALVMTSFNTLDRIPSSANTWLMRDVLRREMGFDGVLISDWAAIAELIVHGVAADGAEAAEQAIRAGVDIDMASPVYIKNIQTLLDQGKLNEAQIDEAALRVLQLKNRLGLFENPYKDASEADEAALLLCDAHRQAARECAEKSLVLLKNQGQLPLNPAKKIAFIGPFVDTNQLNGAWSIFARDEDTATVQDAVSARYSGMTFAHGAPIVEPGTVIVGFQKPVEPDTTDPAAALEEAKALAAQADQVVLMLGEHRDFSGECASKGDLTLPACQLELLRQVAAVNPNVTVVLFCGRPMDLRAVETYAKSILVAWMPGTEGAAALTRVLFGEAEPSGKLSMSFPYCTGQVPVFYNRMNTGRPLTGDYRTTRFASQYRDIPNEPLYPFGYGLTYTTFDCSHITLSGTELTSGKPLTASVTVTNTGERIGTETVQLYLQDLCGSVVRPLRMLRGFQKVTLAPGKSQKVMFTITEEMLRFWNIDMHYTSEPGTCKAYIGFDSNAAQEVAFELI